MIKFHLYFDKDPETVWLNEMAAKGYELKKFFLGFYQFEKGEPGRYQYQIDMTKGLWSVDQDYREFMEEQQVEIVCLWGPWVILRKKTENGDFNLYSDNASMIEHYTKIRGMFKAMTILLVICFFMELYSASKLQEPFFYGMVVLIGAMLLTFVGVVRRLCIRIDALKAEEGLARGGRQPNLLMVAGMMISVGMSAAESLISEPIVMGCQIIGIVMMMVGLYQFARGTK